MKKFIILFLILSPFFVFCQIKTNTEFKVQSFWLEDKLDETSTIDPSYGKYTAFEFDINLNDHFNITVNSTEFTPYMFISSPSGKNIFAYPEKGANTAELDTVANERGKWNLYVVCDTLEKGKFSLTIRFTDKKSYQFPTGNDFCTYLKYFIAHGNADFRFIKKRSKSIGINNWQPPIKFPQSINSFISYENRFVFNTLFYSGSDEKTADQTYAKIRKNMIDCIGKSWMSKDLPANDDYQKYVKFSTIDQPIVYLKYYKKSTNGYRVQLEIESKK
ncbi:MAG: hypothetical protein V1773_03840 [bacterium]